MRLTTLRADLLLLAAAVIWGSGFVAQRLGSEHLDAFEYNGLRFTLGTILLLPLLRFAPWPAHATREASRRATVRGGLLAGCAMVLAANAQQHGLGSTTASNGAFITSLYVVFVPFIALFVSRTRIGWPVWLGVALAGVGLALMGIDRGFHVNPGDAWVLLCAVLWAFHVVIVGRYSRDAEPVRFSLIQLGMTGVAALTVALARGQMDLAAIGSAKWAVLYGAALPVAASSPSFPGFTACDTTTPASMSEAPVYFCRSGRSCRNTMPLIIPNTLSSERMSAVCVGGACFCAIVCSVNAAATGSAAP